MCTAHDKAHYSELEPRGYGEPGRVIRMATGDPTCKVVLSRRYGQGRRARSRLRLKSDGVDATPAVDQECEAGCST